MNKRKTGKVFLKLAGTYEVWVKGFLSASWMLKFLG
jgi:hypothetical protein